MKDVRCPNQGCTIVMKRGDSENHRQTCEWAVNTCECGEKMIERSLKQHKEVKCPLAVLSCPLGCGVNIPSIINVGHSGEVRVDALLGRQLTGSRITLPGREQHPADAEIGVESQEALAGKAADMATEAAGGKKATPDSPIIPTGLTITTVPSSQLMKKHSPKVKGEFGNKRTSATRKTPSKSPGPSKKRRRRTAAYSYILTDAVRSMDRRQYLKAFRTILNHDAAMRDMFADRDCCSISGRKSGVATQPKADNPSIASIHSVAHRLVVGQAGDRRHLQTQLMTLYLYYDGRRWGHGYRLADFIPAYPHQKIYLEIICLLYEIQKVEQ
ncbi:hypothetical protein Bbelb_351050 [Branchiostoma belcheri]|nr:hypothetical protein Bbelb_351050 [Branchiostoma belcheri]